MYLLDTNVLSEKRKGKKADKGVQDFFAGVISEKIPTYLSVITVGELQRGVEIIRYRNDLQQANSLETWLKKVLVEYEDNILDFGKEAAQIWGYLRVPHHENLLDKQVAATALVHDLTVVTRNLADFSSTGVRLINPFMQH